MRRPREEMCLEMAAGPTALWRKAGCPQKAAATAPRRGWERTLRGRGWGGGSGWPGSPGAGLPHPLGLLQLLRQLLQGRRVSLPHVLDLSFVVLSFLLKSLLQLCHFLLTFCTRETYFRESSSELAD